MSIAVFCPICNGNETLPALIVKDFSVSKEFFKLYKCITCDFLFTSSPPSIENIGRYYQSDEYISHTDSNKGFFNKLYQLVRKFTLYSKYQIIVKYSHLTRPGKLLDYGCGTGAFLKKMQSFGWEIAGIEPDSVARSRASNLTNITVLEPSMLDTFQHELFDVITLWHVLEHVHDLHTTLDKLVRRLKPNGLIFIAVPNHTSMDARHYKENWAAYDVPRHLYHFNPASLSQLLKQHGLKITKILPMWFDSFYVSMLSEKYQSGKINILPAFLNGLYSNIKSIVKPGTCSSQIYIIRKCNASK